jgi:predicted ArsR family transcriptional regulator
MDRQEREACIAEVAALDQPVRADLYALLVERDGWVGRDEAAGSAGVPRSVAAFHLDKLAEAGLVETRFERPQGRGGPGAGRPAKKYRRAHREVAVSLPDRRYDLAGALLADAVADAVSTGQPVERSLATAARTAGTDLGAALHAEATDRSDDERNGEGGGGAREAVVHWLERIGYEPHDHGDEVVLANCPFHALAERQRSLVCGMNLEFLRGLVDGMGVDDTLTARLEPEDGMCCVRLHASGRSAG